MMILVGGFKSFYFQPCPGMISSKKIKKVTHIFWATSNQVKKAWPCFATVPCQDACMTRVYQDAVWVFETTQRNIVG